MEDLKKVVEEMLEGEQKRRKKAETFLEQLTEILAYAGPDIWGDGYTDLNENAYKAIWIGEQIYFRYSTHRGSSDVEYPGFYHSRYAPVWGTPLEDIKGPQFWNSLEAIINWVNSLDEQLREKKETRDKILGLLK